MQITDQQKSIVLGAKREIILGIGINQMDVLAQYTEHEVLNLVAKCTSNKTDNIILECFELKLLRNLLSDLIRELASFEFHLRMGYTEDEVFEFMKIVKEEIDNVCYPTTNM